MIRPGRDQRFRPADRIRRKADFDRAYADGARIPARLFTLITRQAGQERPRLGLTLSKAVGGAVVRNRTRRRLREIFRRHREAIGGPVDVVIHVRPAAARASYADLESEFLAALTRLRARRERPT